MKIVCLGDSLTSGYGVARDECWIGLLGRSRHQWINAGVAGDTTAGMLARLRPDVFVHKPCTVLIMGGYNDVMLLNSFDAAKANMMALAHQCAAGGVMPVIGIPIPIHPSGSNPWSDFMELQCAERLTGYYCDWLRCFADTFGFASADLWTPFEAYASKAGDAAYLPDGIHPSPEGHLVIAHTLEMLFS